MCWVMPPASPAATSVSRMASRSDVLPWSTWPMIVTTGGRAPRPPPVCPHPRPPPPPPAARAGAPLLSHSSARAAPAAAPRGRLRLRLRPLRPARGLRVDHDTATPSATAPTVALRSGAGGTLGPGLLLLLGLSLLRRPLRGLGRSRVAAAVERT